MEPPPSKLVMVQGGSISTAIKIGTQALYPTSPASSSAPISERSACFASTAPRTMTRSASQIPWVSYTGTSLGDSSVLLSGPLHDLIAAGATTWQDGDRTVGGDRTVVVEADEGLAAVMKDCDC
uniref:Uncharacterized protein n=1 Tax=Fagus sylvatica TaxID=28930 RepID=A0A2N9HW81_FAGSY